MCDIPQQLHKQEMNLMKTTRNLQTPVVVLVIGLTALLLVTSPNRCDASASFTPYVDAPYLQLNSTIYQLNQLPPLANWLQLPPLGAGIRQLELLEGSTFLLLGSNSLYVFSPLNEADQQFVQIDTKLEITVVNDSRIFVGNQSSSSSFIVVAVPTGVYVCSSSLDTACSFVAYELGSVNDVAQSPIDGIVIGAAAGKFFSRLSSLIFIFIFIFTFVTHLRH